MMSTHSVNVHANARAKGNPVKVVREDSVIIRFQRPISIRERQRKVIEELRGVYMLEKRL